MSNFFDNFCRTLATPMPRSKALKLIAGGLAAVVMAPFAFGQKTCKAPNSTCGSKCCTASQGCYDNQICCGAGTVGAICTNTGNKGKGSVVCIQSNASGNYPTNCTVLQKTP
jgi:hypothetical protein